MSLLACKHRTSPPEINKTHSACHKRAQNVAPLTYPIPVSIYEASAGQQAICMVRGAHQQVSRLAGVLQPLPVIWPGFAAFIGQAVMQNSESNAVRSHAVLLSTAAGVLQRGGGAACVVGAVEGSVVPLACSLPQQILVLMEHCHKPRPDVLCAHKQSMSAPPKHPGTPQDTMRVYICHILLLSSHLYSCNPMRLWARSLSAYEEHLMVRTMKKV